MPRRLPNDPPSNELPRKRHCVLPTPGSSMDLKRWKCLTDISGKRWKLGKAVGVGGFGEIFLASDDLKKEVKHDCNYVAKVESHKNGPLFVEVNCFLRIARSNMIEEWKKKRKLNFLGMPHYVASGSHIHQGERYRFLILPKFEKDLEQVLREKKKFNFKTVLTICCQIMDVLEYIHHKGYIHSDIKASNILLGSKTVKANITGKPVAKNQKNVHPIRSCRLQKFASNENKCHNTRNNTRELRPKTNINYSDYFKDNDFNESTSSVAEKIHSNKDHVYLLDYGLACKYLASDGTHKQICIDERKAHAGTILFCSRDAHKGITSRRSDLESLGYNIIYWLTGTLPWENDVDTPEIVEKKKQKAMANIEYFLSCCFLNYPKFLLKYFQFIHKLNCQETPNYAFCKRLFKENIIYYGYADDSLLDFDNSQVCKMKKKNLKKNENEMTPRFTYTITRPPLQSNIPIKPRLRKKASNEKVKSKFNWFEEVADPESILKQARKTAETETNSLSPLENFDIERLNPTDAMLEIYNRCRERGGKSPTYKSDSVPEYLQGYTSAMIRIHEKIKQRKQDEMISSLRDFKVYLGNIENPRKNIKRCINKRKKKNESPIKPPPKTRTTKCLQVIIRDHFQTKKTKAIPLRRTYSLRG